MFDPTPDRLPDSTLISIAMENPVHAAVFPHLVGAGMIPDPTLLSMIDMHGVTHDKVTGAVGIPANFATDLRARKPYLFAEHRAAFDARKASAADADRRFAEIERGFQTDRAAAANARTLAELRASR